MAHLENSRDKGKSFQTQGSLDICFNDVKSILKENGATVYLEDKNKAYLAAMNFKRYVDTTQVGVFFTEKEPDVIQVDVASLSPKLAAEVADMLSMRLKER
jgi:hypothetical protein